MSTTTEAPITPKKSTRETGHAINVANLQELIAFVTGLGATYNPSKPSLKLAQLNTLAANANAHLTNVITLNVAYNNKVNERVAAFRALKPLVTRLISALQTTDATPQKVADAKAYNRKIRGDRATPSANTPETISTSQQSYDMQIQHFAGLIATLQSEPSYAPNEIDLKMVALIAKQTDLIAKNNAVAMANSQISNARIARDTTLYATDTGVLDTAAEVKQYIRSIYGGASPQFALVKGIPFTKAKK